MRKINVNEITKVVKDLCIKANCYLNEDIKQALNAANNSEKSPFGKEILNRIIENYRAAEEDHSAICQDTGMVIIFCEIGQDVHLVGGSIEEAVNEGIRQGYREGCFRNSVVDGPISRKNTGDNTPAVVYYEMVLGDKLKIQVMPKGFGSENMSSLKMLKPSDGIEGIVNFVIETVDKGGSNPCPPIVVGVGIGGTMDKAALLSKKALLRPINTANPKEELKQLEERLLTEINKLGIGPMGLGGRNTALKVSIETFPTHIAGLPVAVSISCHVTRHSEIII